MKVLKIILNICKGIIIFGGGIVIGGAGMYIFMLHELINDRQVRRRPMSYGDYCRGRA